MRLLAPVTLSLALAACATAPQSPVVQPQPAAAPQPVTRSSGTLIGLTAGELVQRFGSSGFQVREGPGLKLQWSGAGCVLDAFLYPPGPGGGTERVTHIDTRRPTGDPTDQAACITALDALG